MNLHRDVSEKGKYLYKIAGTLEVFGYFTVCADSDEEALQKARKGDANHVIGFEEMDYTSREPGELEITGKVSKEEADESWKSIQQEKTDG